jgi:hypothetical protein
LTGAPASGKTEVVNHLKKDYGLSILETDDYRTEVDGKWPLKVETLPSGKVDVVALSWPAEAKGYVIWDHAVLLDAGNDVLVERMRKRGQFGKTADQRKDALNCAFGLRKMQWAMVLDTAYLDPMMCAGLVKNLFIETGHKHVPESSLCRLGDKETVTNPEQVKDRTKVQNLGVKTAT